MSRFLTITLVVTRPPASRHIRAATFSTAHPLFVPIGQPVSRLLGDGHENRVEGHTSRREREVQATEQNDPEQLSGDACQSADRACGAPTLLLVHLEMTAQERLVIHPLNRRSALNVSLMRKAASCCHPSLVHPGSKCSGLVRFVVCSDCLTKRRATSG